MLTAKQIASLELGIGTDARTIITVNAALEWLDENTTIDTSKVERLPACARLFLIKYAEITSMRAGVTSESIEGLSQSFNNKDQSALIWDAAYELLGSYVKSQVRFVQAKPRWSNGMPCKSSISANKALEERLDGTLNQP